MAYIDCDKCSHGIVCAYRHQYDDHIVTCSHWKPADDVVEVVRCKDCPRLIKEIVEEETPYGFSNKHDVFGCGRILELTGEWVDVFLDDFCSYGERKEK